MVGVVEVSRLSPLIDWRCVLDVCGSRALGGPCGRRLPSDPMFLSALWLYPVMWDYLRGCSGTVLLEIQSGVDGVGLFPALLPL